MKNSNLKKIKKGGFTLIELLVVISIIGLLASVVLSSLNVARTKAKNSAINSNIKDFIIAANLYRNDNGNTLPLSAGMGVGGLWCNTPPGWEVLVCLTSGLCPDTSPTTCKNDTLIKQIFGPYIKAINNPQPEKIGSVTGPFTNGVPSYKTSWGSCSSGLCSVGVLYWYLYPGGTCAYGATSTISSDRVMCELNI